MYGILIKMFKFFGQALKSMLGVHSDTSICDVDGIGCCKEFYGLDEDMPCFTVNISNYCLNVTPRIMFDIIYCDNFSS